MRLLANAQGDDDRGDEDADPAEHEHGARVARHHGNEASERRAQQKPRHLGGAVQPEGLAPPVGRGHVHEVATGSRVVRGGGKPGQPAQDAERQEPGREERQHGEHGAGKQSAHHERLATCPVGQPAEDRLADQARRRATRR